jgi:hypothetical protein
MDMKIGFRAICIHCDTDLHVCKNCRYYCPGKPNHCIIPGTELIQDRERSNLCEEFKPRTKIEETSDKSKAREIFGDDVDKKKPNFDDLFN